MPPPSSHRSPPKRLGELTSFDEEDKVPTPHDAESVDTRTNAFPPKMSMIKTFLAFAGPGTLAGASYVDPGNFESDLQAGAYQGFKLLWVIATSTALGLFMQVLAARLGTVTGRDLASLCGERYSKVEVWGLWFLIQVAIVGCDVQEIVGSAVAFKVLFGFPLWFGALLTFFDTLTFLGLHVSGLRRLEALFLTLIGLVVSCIFVDFFLTRPDAKLMLDGLITPQVPKHGWVQTASLLGSVIMPHNLFLHSALVLSRKVDTNNTNDVRSANWWFAVETSIVLFASFLVNGAIVSVFAQGFHSETCAMLQTPLVLRQSGEKVYPPFACVPSLGHLAEISSATCTSSMGSGTCQPIGLQVAAKPLEVLLGRGARVLWGIGLLASGQISTVTGTFAGQFVMEGMLRLKIHNWQRVALTRIVALVPATAVAILASVDYMAADRLDEWLNVLQSIALPFALIPLLVFSNDAALMGTFVLRGIWSFMAWATCLFVLGINMFLMKYEFAGGSVQLVGFTVVYVLVLWRLWWVSSSTRSSSPLSTELVDRRATETTRLISSPLAHD